MRDREARSEAKYAHARLTGLEQEVAELQRTLRMLMEHLGLEVRHRSREYIVAKKPGEKY